ncbi:MAG: hypothetical protein LAT84_06280 [Balneolia bacterium]|nr:hypothetical protein [Balneolia bacterium]
MISPAQAQPDADTIRGEGVGQTELNVNSENPETREVALDRLDLSGTPTYGSTSLSAWFTPDPFTVSVTSGGVVNAGYINAPGCRGYAASSPDYRLHWNGDGDSLRFYFEANNSNDDTVLLINFPNGQWVCNDDAFSGTLNPMVILDQAQNGRYDIWVASYSEGEYISGTLGISELSSVGPTGYTPPTTSTTQPSTSGGARLDFSATARAGVINLQAGFTPDPHELRLTSGGSVNVSDMQLGSGCRGYAGVAPNVSLQWAGSSSDLRVFFESERSGGDTVLIVNTPNGDWVCNDDAFSGTLNPMLDLSGYGAGRYDIWVASYSRDEFLPGWLSVTELDYQPE